MKDYGMTINQYGKPNRRPKRNLQFKKLIKAIARFKDIWVIFLWKPKYWFWKITR